MSLLFDLTASQPSATSKRHGGGKYCEMLFFAMCQRGLKFQAFWNSTQYINPSILDAAKAANIKLHDIKDTSLNNVVKEQKIKRIYSALPEQILPWPDCTMLGTIHGLRDYEIPFDFFLQRQFDSGIIGLNTFLAWKKQKTNKIRIKKYYNELLNKTNFSFVTDSNHSKKVISEISGRNDIPVFYPPSTSSKNTLPRNNEEYFLLVSANRVEKNCIRAIIALDKLFSKNKISKSKRVKITGLEKPNFRYKIKNSNQFDFLGYVEEIELEKLYANCGYFIYPSLNEGFGYPPLEAMKYGVPVLASKAASIPEVCGDAALYFKPTSVSSLMKKILSIQNNRLYQIQSQKSLKRFNDISIQQKQHLNSLITWIFQTL